MNNTLFNLSLLRLFAFFIDFFILLFLSYFLYLIGLPFFKSPNINIFNYEYKIYLTRLGPIVSWLYHSIFECSKLQSTPGKYFMKLRVSNTLMQRANFAQTTVRHFSKILSLLPFGMGYFLFFFSKKRQCLHDYLAFTIIHLYSNKNYAQQGVTN